MSNVRNALTEAKTLKYQVRRLTASPLGCTKLLVLFIIALILTAFLKPGMSRKQSRNDV